MVTTLRQLCPEASSEHAYISGQRAPPTSDLNDCGELELLTEWLLLEEYTF